MIIKLVCCQFLQKYLRKMLRDQKSLQSKTILLEWGYSTTPLQGSAPGWNFLFSEVLGLL